MKAPKETKIDIDICMDCDKEGHVERCPDCLSILCKTCLAIHKDEHLEEHYAEEVDEEEEYDKRPSKKNWD